MHQSKWELALAMLDEMEGLVSYEWVNADGFYDAQGSGLGLGQRQKDFVLDIHQHQGVYLTHPLP